MTNLERVLAKFPENVDALLITSAENRFYVSGMHSSAGCCLLFRDIGYFIIDFRYIEKARATVKELEVQLQTKRDEQLLSLLREHNARSVAIEESVVTVEESASLAKNLEGVRIETGAGLSDLMRELRAVKTPEELACLHTAQEYTDAGFAHICKFIKAGMTEREIALELEFYMRKLGSEGASFDFIAVSGPNSSLPHGVPGDRKIRKGDFLTLDFGGVSGGYRADMTRTVGIGVLDSDQLHVYDTVLQAQTATLQGARAGITGKQMDAIARDIIEAAGFGENFGHGLGHSLGLQIHEWPFANTRCDTVLLPGMMMTVEPGIYLPGRFGVRIEDMVLLNEDGCEDFTHSPNELILL